jgi:hypothetical protein
MAPAVPKLAFTTVSAFMVTVHGAVPLQPPPLQPVKTVPNATLFAARVTEVPG